MSERSTFYGLNTTTASDGSMGRHPSFYGKVPNSGNPSPRRSVDKTNSGRRSTKGRTRSPSERRGSGQAAPKYRSDFNLRVVKASVSDCEGVVTGKELVERVYRESFPPKDLETKQTITAKMFLDGQALVRLKMSRAPCAAGPSPSNAPSFSGGSRPNKTSSKLDETQIS